MPPKDLDSPEPDPLWLEFEKAKARAKPKRDLIRELLWDLGAEPLSGRAFEIDSYLADRTDAARQRTSQLRKELEGRLALHRKFVSEIDAQLLYCQTSLSRFTGWGVGYNTGVDVKRNHLERQSQQLRAERRNAELRAWQDLVKLRGELREAQREYRDADRLKTSTQE
jgi:hypothetical protein